MFFSPRVLYPEKLHSGWTSFRGAGQTAFSLTFLWNEKTRGDATTIHITAGEDETKIRSLCQKYEGAIELAMSLSVTVSALCLKTLNWFSLPEVRCPSIERWNFDDVPGWRKARDKLSKGPVH